MDLINSRLTGGILAFAATAVLAQTEDVTPGRIREKVSIQRTISIGEEVELRVPMGQAVRLDCADNPYWLKECLVYPSKVREVLWVVPIDVDGALMKGINGHTLRLQRRGIQRVADGPCFSFQRWEIQEQSVLLHFCLSTNQEHNQREFDLHDAEVVDRKLGDKPYPCRLPEAERLAGFARLWSEVKFNFVSFDRVPELDWDKVLTEYLPRVQQAETREEYFRVLAQCLALLHDGHTDLYYSRGRNDIYYSSGRPHLDYGASGLPIEVRPLAGKQAVIVRTVPLADICGQKRKQEFIKADLKPGEELTHVDGRAVKDILERDLYPYISASTPQGRDLGAYPRLLLGRYGSLARLRVKGLDGSEREVALTRKDYSPNLSPKSKGFECRNLEGDLVYVNLPSFGSRDIVTNFQRVLSQVLKSKGLILDVRRNGGGNSGNGDAIISMLTDTPVRGTRWKTRKYLPAFRAWGRKEQWHGGGDIIQPSKDKPFLGPVVVLIGPATFSAAEDFVVPLHASKRATVIGERTGGSTGQPLPVELPGGGHARICTKRDTYPDGREFVGVGVIPDIEVHLTATDIAADKDVILEKAIQVLSTAQHSH